MPNIKSAKKRMRSSVKKTDTNTLVNSSMRTAIKKFEKEAATNETHSYKETERQNNTSNLKEIKYYGKQEHDRR